MKDTNPAASFGHIMGGYESRYYGYQWALVYSSDLFTEFQKHGLLNKEVGMKYRKKILAPGGTKPAMELMKDFLGREPNDEAYLKMKGFK
jgi:Zn-dependent oligopeptidase